MVIINSNFLYKILVRGYGEAKILIPANRLSTILPKGLPVRLPAEADVPITNGTKQTAKASIQFRH